MKRQNIDPPKDQWDKLPHLDGLSTGLTYGENLVYNLFDELLPPQWEMYIQPFLNGLRPDLVLLNPAAGIAVFEVKDWKLSTIESFTKSEYLMKNPLKKISLYKDQLLEIYCPRLKGRFGDDATATVTAGLIFTLVSERDLERIFGRNEDGKLVSRLDNSDRNLKHLFDQSLKLSKYYPLVGKETLSERNLYRLFPESKRRSSFIMQKDIAEDLRGWLKDPAFNQELRQPIEIDLSDPQIREIINNNRGAKYRRVKGTAGSGKSLTLAMRAAEIASQNKQVLVCSYNITLINYLRPLAYRHASDLARNGKIDSPEVIRHRIVFLNYHAWAKRVCQHVGKEREYKQLWRRCEELREERKQILQDDSEQFSFIKRGNSVKKSLIEIDEELDKEEKKVLTHLLPNLILQIYQGSSDLALYLPKLNQPHLLPSQTHQADFNMHSEIPLMKVAEETNQDITQDISPPFYDAILVDEGQDFTPLWWQSLRQAVKQDGEMLLVADKTQNIYGTAQAWTEEEMRGAGFSGDWMRLKTSYRIPPKITPILEYFTHEFFIPKIQQCQHRQADISDIIDIPDVERFTFEDITVELYWMDVPDRSKEIDICFQVVNHYMMNLPSDCANSDIVFISQQKNIGEKFVRKCEKHGVNVNHTFGEDKQDEQRKKLAFSLDYSTIKATTLHSYKGWEGRLLVIHVNRITNDTDCALFYSALTRLKKHTNGSRLTVVSSCSELRGLGSKYFERMEEKSNLLPDETL
ncbi:AAA family ATPase [Candidatus Poribacteria bacterium]|nr:AAA family ATPase [Candidatus Poribacteria bacterium]